jgi:NADH:ubiquinone oxidoreductase subunit 2 (subunit N)
VWLEFIILYSLTLFIVINFLELNKIFFLKELVRKRLITKLLIVIFLLSMGGIPPFSGFFIKLMLVKNIIFFMPLNLVLVLILSFLILYLYIRVFTASLINNFINRVSRKPKFTVTFLRMLILSPAPIILFSLV